MSSPGIQGVPNQSLPGPIKTAQVPLVTCLPNTALPSCCEPALASEMRPGETTADLASAAPRFICGRTASGV